MSERSGTIPPAEDSGAIAVVDPLDPIVIHPEIHGGSDDERVLVRARFQTVATAPDTLTGVIEAVPAAAVVPEASLVKAPAKRAFSLDALRGLFLLSMTAGFTISFLEYPAWMYHRQFPPPGDTLVNVAGIGWRDLAYGAFLFTMAAALPLTLSRRIDKGEVEIGIIAASIKRFAMLLVFALLIGHSNTFFIGYTQTGRALAVVGFVIMALIFTRRRNDWNERHNRLARRTGWALAIAFLALSPLTYGKTFSFARIDDIIAGLAFASLAGSVIWYFTRDNLNARLVILAFTVALVLGAKEDGWLQQIWYSSPVPWAFAPDSLALLTVVIPGTIVGDVVLRWMRSPGDPVAESPRWDRGRIVLLAVLAAACTPIVVVGLYSRAIEATTQIVFAMLAGMVALTWRPSTSVERMLRSLVVWGGLWLALGLVLEPFEGGIKKVPATLSYFFTVTGTTTLLLVSLTALIDVLGRKKLVSALIDVGHNPLLCYVLYTVLINSVFELVPPLRGVLRGSAGEAVLRSLIEVVLVVIVVRFVSRQRIYWRS
jgi:predicted acyltransferase